MTKILRHCGGIQPHAEARVDRGQHAPRSVKARTRMERTLDNSYILVDDMKIVEAMKHNRAVDAEHVRDREVGPRMKITAKTNGPFLIEGDVNLLDQNGKPYDSPNPTKFALCRCGGSAKKPFCDGAHAKSGFECPPQPG